MAMSELRARAANKFRRVLVQACARQQFPLASDSAYISFTFDDFPRSAYLRGGRILREYGARGTYYVAMQLLEKESPVGTIASRDDLRALVADGHEVGCHTFGHLDGMSASVEEYTRSLDSNQEAFQKLVPGGQLRTFAYPFDGPRLAVKRALIGRFLCCRGGGQTFNRGILDLALVKSYFIDHRAGDSVAEIAELIASNNAARGWLVLSTHDVADRPSPFGCRPQLFEEIVRLAGRSGARVLPVGEVCQELGVRPVRVAGTAAS
jgi:peptidoglycan/xylan/chitin deacetylase (PgdA/CDA1 family)